MNQPRETFWSGRRVVRFLLLWVGTTTLFYSLVTVFMPPGFSGVPYMGFVFFLFLVVFSCVPLFEPSVEVNVALALTFWLPAFVLLILFPGTAPGKAERILQEGLVLTCVAVAHMTVQCLWAYALFRWTEKEKMSRRP